MNKIKCDFLSMKEKKSQIVKIKSVVASKDNFLPY